MNASASTNTATGFTHHIEAHFSERTPKHSEWKEMLGASFLNDVDDELTHVSVPLFPPTSRNHVLARLLR